MVGFKMESMAFSIPTPMAWSFAQHDFFLRFCWCLAWILEPPYPGFRYALDHATILAFLPQQSFKGTTHC
ncbi:MAG TPA: hypothetical protein DCS88_13615 [Alphaproteobacteria bacterium]|nr:hypothetical protein [Alphaproteobacteria bacterium]